MHPNLGHLKADLQLAEMAYNADPTEYKKTVYEKALATYEAAWKAEQDSNELIVEAGALATQWISELSRLEEANRQLEFLKHSLEHENQALFNDKAALANEISFLNSQLIEKAQTIDLLHKELSSVKSAPATPASKPLTGAAKAAAEAKAAKAAAEATQPPAAETTIPAAPATTPAETADQTEDAKKNS